MAISGLVLLVYSIAIPPILFDRNLAQIENIASDAASLKADIELLAATLSVDPVSPGDTKEARRRLESSADAKRRNAMLEVKIKIVHRLNQQILFIAVTAGISFLLGLATTAAGFYFWYKRLQVHQDSLVKRKGPESQAPEGGNSDV